MYSQYSFKTLSECVDVTRNVAINGVSSDSDPEAFVELKVEQKVGNIKGMRELERGWSVCMCSQMYLQVKYALNVSFCEATTYAPHGTRRKDSTCNG